MQTHGNSLLSRAIQEFDLKDLKIAKVALNVDKIKV
jgi:hypothetical protein